MFKKILGNKNEGGATVPASSGAEQGSPRFVIRSVTPSVESGATNDRGAAGRTAYTELAGDIFSDTAIDHPEGLPFFSETLYKVVELRDSLHTSVCPIAIETKADQNRFALVLQEDDLYEDFVFELIRQLEFKKYVKADPLYYVVTNSVMLELARGTITSHKRGGDSMSHNFSPDEQSVLLQTFREAAKFALANEAADIHFEIHTEHRNAQSYIKFGIDGHLCSPKQFNLPTRILHDTLAFIYNSKGYSVSENSYNQNKKQQCQIKLTANDKHVMFRWASAPCAYGNKVVLRVIPQPSKTDAIQVRSLEDLGYLPQQIEVWKRNITAPVGGIIGAGPVGSGKSTLFQTIMSMMPDTMVKYTVEEPVEYRMGNDVAQMSVSRTLDDREEDPYLEFKRQLKRMAPDVVLIGEMRDHATAGLFRDIAESGHRAFSTVHAPSAIDIVTLRLVSPDFGIPKEVIATPGFLNLLAYQTLVSKVCPECHLPATEVHPTDYMSKIEKWFQVDISNMRARNHEGCSACRRDGVPELNGFGKRIVCAEMIEVTEDMLDFISKGDPIGLKKHIRKLRTTGFDDPDSTGKSALEVAMYHVTRGVIDPRSVEDKFGSFEVYARNLGKLNAK